VGQELERSAAQGLRPVLHKGYDRTWGKSSRDLLNKGDHRLRTVTFKSIRQTMPLSEESRDLVGGLITLEVAREVAHSKNLTKRHLVIDKQRKQQSKKRGKRRGSQARARSATRRLTRAARAQSEPPPLTLRRRAGLRGGISGALGRCGSRGCCSLWGCVLPPP